ncbi:acyl-CoA N-acyltransferase [Lentinula aff. detonsa]|uniref:Acyl-CoA N-acyltransferase n=1 Tax=Lentinula aff. detonsa TaxID=2804958 RepID=A0AA38TY64_9AGAR|nr:acyl-CoA N-acyltransferase [Lentinula aff. detonsa]
MTSNSNSYTIDGITLKVCPPSSYRSIIPELAVLLKSCVDSNITMNFIQPFSLEDASEFWLSAEDNVKQGKQFVVIAQEAKERPEPKAQAGGLLHDPSDQEGTDDHVIKPPVILGCVILYLSQLPNAKHRGEVGKLIVGKEHRKRGIGKMLLSCLEDKAREHGRTILVLDTQTGSGAELFYEHIEYTKVGVIPDVTMAPDGTQYTSCTFFYKKL